MVVYQMALRTTTGNFKGLTTTELAISNHAVLAKSLLMQGLEHEKTSFSSGTKPRRK